MEVVEVSHNKGKQLENHWVDRHVGQKRKRTEQPLQSLLLTVLLPSIRPLIS